MNIYDDIDLEDTERSSRRAGFIWGYVAGILTIPAIAYVYGFLEGMLLK